MGIIFVSTTGILCFQHTKRSNFKMNDLALKGFGHGGGFVCSVKPFLTRQTSAGLPLYLVNTSVIALVPLHCHYLCTGLAPLLGCEPSKCSVCLILQSIPSNQRKCRHVGKAVNLYYTGVGAVAFL